MPPIKTILADTLRVGVASALAAVLTADLGEVLAVNQERSS
jgi:hypothetical protein